MLRIKSNQTLSAISAIALITALLALWGAMIAAAQADTAVKFVDSFEDEKVKIVDNFEDEKWKITTYCTTYPDIKIKLVDNFEDKKVKIVDNFEDKKICIRDINQLTTKQRVLLKIK